MKSNSATTPKQEPVAKLYAKALFELVQEKSDSTTTEDVLKDLVGFTEVLRENPNFKQALSAFMFPIADRQKLLHDYAEKADQKGLVIRFFDLLISKGRLVLIESITYAFQALVDESKNTVRGTVVTIEPLTEAENTDLSQTFGRKLNKKVVLESVIDKEILGGLIVQIQGLTFDGSLKTTIRRLRENLERQSI